VSRFKHSSNPQLAKYILPVVGLSSSSPGCFAYHKFFAKSLISSSSPILARAISLWKLQKSETGFTLWGHPTTLQIFLVLCYCEFPMARHRECRAFLAPPVSPFCAQCPLICSQCRPRLDHVPKTTRHRCVQYRGARHT
jgi:hypothetical protein